MREGAASLAVLVLTIPLAGCGGGVDAPRAAACRRALPALVAGGMSPTVLRVGAGPGPSSVRVDYRLDPRGDAKARWIACRFGVGTRIEAITTESGPVGGASLYLLRRYYLDTPDAGPAP